MLREVCKNMLTDEFEGEVVESVERHRVITRHRDGFTEERTDVIITFQSGKVFEIAVNP